MSTKDIMEVVPLHNEKKKEFCWNCIYFKVIPHEDKRVKGLCRYHPPAPALRDGMYLSIVFGRDWCSKHSIHEDAVNVDHKVKLAQDDHHSYHESEKVKEARVRQEGQVWFAHPYATVDDEEVKK